MKMDELRGYVSCMGETRHA